MMIKKMNMKLMMKITKVMIMKIMMKNTSKYEDEDSEVKMKNY